MYVNIFNFFFFLIKKNYYFLFDRILYLNFQINCKLLQFSQIKNKKDGIDILFIFFPFHLKENDSLFNN